MLAYGIPANGDGTLLLFKSAFSASFKADSLQTVMKQFIFLFAFSILSKKNFVNSLQEKDLLSKPFFMSDKLSVGVINEITQLQVVRLLKILSY